MLRKGQMIAAIIYAEHVEFNTSTEDQHDRSEALNMLSRSDVIQVYNERNMFIQKADGMSFSEKISDCLKRIKKSARRSGRVGPCLKREGSELGLSYKFMEDLARDSRTQSVLLQ